ncbi:MAG: hypothetical protein V4760_05560 [Bdellovibrionota bacterium]
MKIRLRLLTCALSLPMLLATSIPAHAESETSARNRGCGSDYECGSMSVATPSRPYQPPPQQPAATATQGACGTLPLRYQARSQGADCGSATVGGSRFPEKVDPDKLDFWNRALKAGMPEDAQKERLSTNVGWQGTVNVPVTETWSWTEMVGDYENPRYCFPNNPMESIETTCTIPREEIYYKDVEEEDRSVCKEYYPEPEVSTSSPSGGGGGYDSSGSSSPSIDTGPATGSGESESDLDDDYGMNRYSPILVDRHPAAACKTYGTKMVSKKFKRYASPIIYSCVKQFPRYCVHPVSRTEQRACRPQPVTYQVKYMHSPEWKPGYKDPKFPYRNYDHFLPNRFDLLVGEDERMSLTLNTAGRSTTLVPALKLESLWNEYKVGVDRSSRLQCANGVQPVVKIAIVTVGRKKRTAPNALTVPYRVVNVNGKQVKQSVAYTFEQERLKNGKTSTGRPTVLTVNDQSRSLMLDASLVSRIYGRTDSPNHTETTVPTENISTAANGGFWVDTQYRLQMFRKDKWGRWVRTTGPTNVNQNQVRYNNDEFSITLSGQDAAKKFYRPAGLLDGLLGGVYKHFGVEITPGETYYWKVWMVTKGFPWYESGCKGNKTNCEGEQASTKAFSEPLLVEWKAPKDVDHRSIVKKIIDFQEWLSPF